LYQHIVSIYLFRILVCSYGIPHRNTNAWFHPNVHFSSTTDSFEDELQPPTITFKKQLKNSLSKGDPREFLG
jgi:hypothetical protein